MSKFTVPLNNFHFNWSKDHQPILRIRSGDQVRFEINEVTSCQITEKSTAADVPKLDQSKFFPLSGPIYIEEAHPGDALIVDILNIKVADWGWSAIIPGFSLLEEFKEPFLWLWDLKNKHSTTFKRGIRIPIRPFCGVMGVAPEEGGMFQVLPPGQNGGNMDIRHLTAGSRLILPVYVDGALFSVGDLHAAQGDGEFFSAIYCSGEATMIFHITKGADNKNPSYYTPYASEAKNGYYATTGISHDLMFACKAAVRQMISYLVQKYDLTHEEAYLLSSITVDLRIHEIVNKPKWVVGAMLPMDILPKKDEMAKTVMS